MSVPGSVVQAISKKRHFIAQRIAYNGIRSKLERKYR